MRRDSRPLFYALVAVLLVAVAIEAYTALVPTLARFEAVTR